MKVALAHDFLVKLGGAERVLKVFADLFPEAPIFTLFYDEKAVGSTFPRERIRGLPLQKMYTLSGRRQRFMLPLMDFGVERLDMAGYDLILSSNTALIHGIVPTMHQKHICYCHSPARYIWDYYHPYKREARLDGLTGTIITRYLHSLRMWDRAAAGRVDTWIANSKNVQKRIRKYFRSPSQLLYPPIDVKRFSVHRNHENYFLIVSTLTTFKRLDIAIELFNRIGRKLVIIGDGPERERLEQISEKNIEFLGFQSDAMVKEYMEHCRAFLFLSDDDFGIAPVEAMSCGKPVIAFARGGALETVFPGVTGELFKDQNPESLEAGLVRFFLHEKNYDASMIRSHAEQFDQQVFIEKIQEIVKNYRNS